MYSTRITYADHAEWIKLNLIEEGGSEEGLLDESASRLDLLHVQTTHSGAVGSTSGWSAHGCERRSACGDTCQGSGLQHGSHFLCSFGILLPVFAYIYVFDPRMETVTVSCNKKGSQRPVPQRFRSKEI